jgi:hypothetical protein
LELILMPPDEVGIGIGSGEILIGGAIAVGVANTS